MNPLLEQGRFQVFALDVSCPDDFQKGQDFPSRQARDKFQSLHFQGSQRLGHVLFRRGGVGKEFLIKKKRIVHQAEFQAGLVEKQPGQGGHKILHLLLDGRMRRRVKAHALKSAGNFLDGVFVNRLHEFSLF